MCACWSPTAVILELHEDHASTHAFLAKARDPSQAEPVSGQCGTSALAEGATPGRDERMISIKGIVTRVSSIITRKSAKYPSIDARCVTSALSSAKPLGVAGS